MTTGYPAALPHRQNRGKTASVARVVGSARGSIPPGGASPMEARRAAVRALRSAALAGVAFLLLTANPSASAPDEVVAFRECAFDWIPWTSTIEEAKAKGKAEGRLVLAFVFPWDATAYEAGYEGAERVRAHDRAAAPEDDA